MVGPMNTKIDTCERPDGAADGINAMVGGKVVAVLAAQDQSSLWFARYDGRVFEWAASGDCCSESWFADVDGLDDLIGKEILAVEVVDMPSYMPDYNVNDGRCRQDADAVYGYKITTDGGYCDVVFRCSSNGYYGGWMTCHLHDTPGEALDELSGNTWAAPAVHSDDDDG